MKRHVLIIFGTRPEGIKMMPVVKALRSSDRMRTTVAVTGQHREMLDQVFSVFNEHPDVDLNLDGSQSDTGRYYGERARADDRSLGGV